MTINNIKLDELRFARQLGVMLALQGKLTGQSFPDRKNLDLAWHRAIYVEAGKHLENIKSASPVAKVAADRSLVYIWQAGLAWYLQRFGQPVGSEALSTAVLRRVRNAVQSFSGAKECSPEASSDLRARPRAEWVDQLVAKAGQGLFDTQAFVALLAHSGWTFEELFHQYTGYAVYAQFCIDRGRATASWSALTVALATVAAPIEEFANALYVTLTRIDEAGATR